MAQATPPRVVEAVGTAVAAGRRDDARHTEAAMRAAVEDCLAHGIADPAAQREAILRSREAAKLGEIPRP